MKKLLIITAVFVLAFGTANAVTVGLHSDNAGIGTMTYSVSGSNIYIWEDWTVTGRGFLELNEFVAFQDYTVYKYITNNTGVDWDHFSNELLDPGLDSGDPTPQPAWIPTGYSSSNDGDGLSFAQGSGIARTSEHFGSLLTDELANRDYLDFFGGLVAGSGGTDTVSFGIRDHSPTANQPFLLAQRPNEFTNEEVIPEPTTMLLFGLGLAGVAIRKRFLK